MPGGMGGGGAVGGDYTIEVVVVEIADPKGDSAADAASTSGGQ
jgi:hypothetical protein